MFAYALEDNPYIQRYLSEPEYRARISLYAGLLINSAYIVFKAGLGIYYRSVWYGVVAVYYIVLSAIRFFLVQSDRKTLTEEQALHHYRLTGLSMLFLNMAMAGMMIQMIWYGNGYELIPFKDYSQLGECAYIYQYFDNRKIIIDYLTSKVFWMMEKTAP